ncbi:MAG: UvrB/UvrC motif-containing protein [Verrucomicrobiota bacterium]
MVNPPDDCQSCDKEKTIHLTQIIGGSLKKIDLCSDCPHAKNLTDSQTFGLADQLLGLGATANMEQITSTETCGNCGFTLRDFRKTGRLGCSVCYLTFFPGVERVLNDTQKGTEHVGKRPLRQKERELLRERIREINEEMDQAIANEDYEAAARLRDELRTCEDSLRNEQEAKPLELQDPKAMSRKKTG